MINKILDLVNNVLDYLINLVDSYVDKIYDSRTTDVINIFKSNKIDTITIKILKLKILDITNITKQDRNTVIEQLLKLSEVSDSTKNIYRKLLK